MASNDESGGPNGHVYHLNINDGNQSNGNNDNGDDYQAMVSPSDSERELNGINNAVELAGLSAAPAGEAAALQMTSMVAREASKNDPFNSTNDANDEGGDDDNNHNNNKSNGSNNLKKPPLYGKGASTKSASINLSKSGIIEKLPCPQLNANIFSMLYMGWVTPLLRLGASRPLENADIWDTYPAERMENVYDEFDGYWKHEEEEVESGRKSKEGAICRVVTKMFGLQFLFAALIFGYVNADQLLGPYFLKNLTIYAQDRETEDIPLIDGFKWVIALFVSAIGASLCRAYSLHLTLRIFLRVRIILTHAIVRKAMSVNPRFRNDGAINNLASADTQKVIEFAQSVHNIWSAPVIIGVGVYELWDEVGWPAFIGLAIMIVVLPIAAKMTVKQMVYQREAAKRTDKRVTIINDFLQGMRVVKMYAWEKPFLETVHKIRDNELDVLKLYAYLKSFTFGFLMLVPLFVSIAIFILYNVNNGDMTPSTVFTTISLVNVIRMPFTFLPIALAGLTQTLVGFGRIEAFLFLPNMKDQRQKLDRVGVVMKDAQFTWEGNPEDKNWLDNRDKKKKLKKPQKQPVQQQQTMSSIPPTSPSSAAPGSQRTLVAANEATSLQLVPPPEAIIAPPRLTRINLEIKQGELVMIFGSVASGKSTLLMGMLGEVLQTNGVTEVGGKIAYVPQGAFIVNATVRENIVFGNPFSQSRYDRAVHACALRSDFELLANGDMSEIGERGLTISGGQKQRINLARALYAPSDIIIMDDSLSAVDMHVATHIFHNCINGEMKGKTRILVTHSLQFAHLADKIILLTETPEAKDSYTIGAMGTFEDLSQNSADFKALLDTYHKGKSEMTVDKSNHKKNETIAQVVKKDEKGATARGKLTSTEEREEGEISWAVYKSYFSAGGSLFFYFAVPFFFICFQTFQTLSDIWLAMWTNNMTNGTSGLRGIDTTVGYLLVYGILLFLAVVALLARTTTMSLFGVRASRNLHKNLAIAIMGRSISWFDSTPTGRIINRFSKDFYLIDLLLAMMLEFAFSTMISVIGILVVIAYVIPVMLAVFAVLFVFYYFITKYFRYSNRELQRLESISRTPIYTHLGEILNGITTIRALHLQDLYIDENYRRINNNTRCFYYSRMCMFWIRIRLDFIAALILGGAGCLAVSSKKTGLSVTPGNFGLLIAYSLNIGAVLNMSALLGSQVEAMMNSVERVKYFTDVRPEEWEKWDAQDQRISESTKVGWPSAGKIVLDNLQMRYRADLDLVIKGVSVTIPPGTRVGIVGRTGSSKSSLLVALFRLVEPCGGRILIDDVDIQKISLFDLRSKIAIIPQDATMFNGTLRYNLDPFNSYSDDEIWTCLDYIQMRGVVDRLPNKLETLIAEAGSNLSTGQRQLLCLARALLRKPKIICLDEATANVDITTDEILQTVIRKQFNGCTILTIAHRLNTILDYDLVIVMKSGQIAEMGSPHELRDRQNGLFSSMLLGNEEDQ